MGEPFWRRCEECGKSKLPDAMLYSLVKYFCNEDCKKEWVKKTRQANARTLNPKGV